MRQVPQAVPQVLLPVRPQPRVMLVVPVPVLVAPVQVLVRPVMHRQTLQITQAMQAQALARPALMHHRQVPVPVALRVRQAMLRVMPAMRHQLLLNIQMIVESSLMQARHQVRQAPQAVPQARQRVNHRLLPLLPVMQATRQASLPARHQPQAVRQVLQAALLVLHPVPPMPATVVPQAVTPTLQAQPQATHRVLRVRQAMLQVLQLPMIR